MKKSITIITLSLLFTQSAFSYSEHGYTDAHLTPSQLKQMLKKTGCDKQLNAFFKNMFKGNKHTAKPSEKCLQLMEGRIKK